MHDVEDVMLRQQHGHHSHALRAAPGKQDLAAPCRQRHATSTAAQSRLKPPVMQQKKRDACGQHGVQLDYYEGIREAVILHHASPLAHPSSCTWK